MKYVVLVSHGTFAPGLHSVLNMLAGGGREDILSTSLQDGMGADEFAENFGIEVDMNKLFSVLYNKALEGDPDCGGFSADDSARCADEKGTARKDNGFRWYEFADGTDGNSDEGCA